MLVWMMVHSYLISSVTNYQKVTGDCLKNVQFDEGGKKRKQESVLIFSPAIIFGEKIIVIQTSNREKS